MEKWLSVLWSVDSKVMVSFTESAGQLMRILQRDNATNPYNDTDSIVELLILATSGQKSCNNRTTFFEHADRIPIIYGQDS